MRITNMMTNNTLVRNLNRHQMHLDETQAQLSTGVRIRKPSDDPGLATNQMFFRSRKMHMQKLVLPMNGSCTIKVDLPVMTHASS